MPRNTEVTIDPGAIAHNLKRVQHWAGASKVMAVVKADAYGHRIEGCIPALADADLLAVATLEEARAIRRLGTPTPILLLEGVSDAKDLGAVDELGLELVVHSAYQLDALKAWGRSPAPRLWLKINTGMNRLGVRPEQAKAMHAELLAVDGVETVCLMSHFASAGGSHQTTEDQIQCFDQAVAGLEGPQCMANSAALLTEPSSHRDWVRAGLVLYGVSPLQDQSAAQLGLEPAMRVEAELIAINPIRAGERVGYGGRFKASQDMVLGVVAIGYGDGYPRAMKDGAPVWINGQIAPLVGRVSMDMITIDISAVADPKVGDLVRLWGPGVPVEEVARWADTIPYELVCRLTRRVRYNMNP